MYRNFILYNAVTVSWFKQSLFVGNFKKESKGLAVIKDRIASGLDDNELCVIPASGNSPI